MFNENTEKQNIRDNIKDIKEVCLVGYYGFGNIGDDAILLAALEEYTKAYDLYVRILANKDLYLYKMLKNFGLDNKVVIYDRWDLKSISECIYYSDAVIFGGGGIFQDKTSLKSFLYYFFIAFLAKIKGKKIIIERNSIGPLNHTLSRFLFSKVLEWADYVSVRDNLSLKFLNENYPKFYYKCFKKEDFVLSFISSELFKKYIPTSKYIDILFILRPFKGLQKFMDLIKNFINKFTIKIMVFQEDDLENIKLGDLGNLIEIKYPGKGEINKVLELIESSKLVISNRLHGIILAYIRGIKTIGISVDPKIEGFCKDYGIEFYKEEELENVLEELKIKIENNL